MTSKHLTKTKSSIELTEYAPFILELKKKIRESQLRASLSVNHEMLKLYWEIGKDITEKQEKEGWGTKVLEKIATDLQNEFPGIAGFSRANLFRMRAFYAAYAIVAQPVRQLSDIPVFNIPWGHNIAIFEGVKDPNVRLWYAQMTLSEGWSRYTLMDAIKKNFYKSHGKAITNFKERLPAPQSALAQDTLHDPYHFDFLELGDAHKERDLENGLIAHVEKFMRELGQGFAFVGRQYPITVGDHDYFLDLLFYHLKLRCFVVVELKSVGFQPEHAGKINFYLSAIDSQMKHETDNPSIGLLICKTKDNFVAEYALRDINKPIGVAEYETKIVSSLPKKLEGKLPTIEEIEAEFKNQSTH